MVAEGQQNSTATGGGLLRWWLGVLATLLVLWGGWTVYAIVQSKGKVNPVRMLINLARSSPTTRRYIPPPYRYFTTWKKALQEARRLNRPIFLDLYAVWCYPCKRLERNTFSHPSVNAVLQKYLVVKFNIDKPSGRRLVRRFRVRRFPTTLMISAKGREMERVVGYYPPRFFRTAVVDALKPNGTYRDLKRRFRRNSQDRELALRFANRALLRRKIREARQIFNLVLSADPNNAKGYGARALFGYARTQSRISQYKEALATLQRFHKRFPKSKVRIDAYRLQLYSLFKLKRNEEYHRTYALFRRKYPGQTTKFE